LIATLRRCSLFVIIVDPVWDSSTWMGEEAHAALESHLMVPHLPAFFWNPDRVAVRAAGMVRYLKAELPIKTQEAVRILASEAGRITTRCS
jgi:hypothetical protein